MNICDSWPKDYHESVFQKCCKFIQEQQVKAPLAVMHPPIFSVIMALHTWIWGCSAILHCWSCQIWDNWFGIIDKRPFSPLSKDLWLDRGQSSGSATQGHQLFLSHCCFSWLCVRGHCPKHHLPNMMPRTWMEASVLLRTRKSLWICAWAQPHVYMWVQ